MRDWLIILLIALLSVGIGLWVLRRRPSPVTSAEPMEPNERPAEVAKGPRSSPPSPLAVLEFEGEPGAVPMRRPEIVIGRHSEDDIRIPDVRVSRHHAKIVASRDGRFEIHNLTAVRSEPNPMLVNGEIREHADISDGDVVSLGGVIFTLRLKAA
jgi:hypothetical protein